MLIITALLNLLAAFIVIARDNRKLENIAFFGVAFGIACWSIGIAEFTTSNSFGEALNWAKFYYFSPILLVFSLVILSQYLHYKKKLPFTANIVIAAGGFMFSFLLFTQKHFLTSALVHRPYGKQVILQPVDYALYSVYLLACIIITISIMYSKLTVTKQAVLKQQTRVFLIGICTSCISGLYFNLILPWLGNYKFIAVGPITTTFFFFSVAYAVVRHRLFDIKLILARALTYTFALVIVAAFYGFIVLSAVKVIFKPHLTLMVQVFLATATTIVALSFQSIKKLFDKITSRYFYQDAYDVQSFLDEFNKVIVSTFELNPLLTRISDLIDTNVKPSYCLFGILGEKNQTRCIIGTKNHPKFGEDELLFVRSLMPKLSSKLIDVDMLEDKHKGLQALLQSKNVSIIIRLATNLREEGIGYIILGPKKSGNIYSSQDVKVLEIVANELVVAIQNAMHMDEIERFNITLQDKVHTATKQLRNSNEKLRALDEAKDDFVSMASHQLRTPLTSVKGNISLVLDGDAGKITGLQRQLLEQAFSSSQRMVYLIADLLNVSRLKTGKFMIEQTPVDLAAVVEDEVNQLVDTATSRHLTLTYHKPQSITTLKLDETKTRQVIMNFIDNAIYYTPAGGKIDVVLSETPLAVELRVIDSGIGVPKNEQHHLFSKFYRAGNARKVRPDGTGLGLFMAKKIVIAEGGAIIFETSENQGSIFGFSIPKSRLIDSLAQTMDTKKHVATSV